MNTVMHGTKDGSKWTIKMMNENAQMFYKIVPMLLHLCLGRYDPQLRSELRIMNPKGKGRAVTGSPRRHSRILIWGVDSIRYICEGDTGVSRSRHWVSSHIRRIELSSEEAIRKYRKARFPVDKEDGRTIGYRIIRGHYRGTGEDSNWDGTYRFGKSPTYYSAKAIRWLDYVANKEGIEIQHAERGGELRFETKESFVQVDGFCHETGTVFEFHGDRFHGNPELFHPDENCHPHRKEWTAGFLYEKTIQREAAIKALGFDLVTMWERDWDLMERKVLESMA